MKRRLLLLLLTFTMLLSLTVTAFADKEQVTALDDIDGKYLSAMQTLASKYSIDITNNYFVLDLGIQNMTGTTVADIGMKISTTSEQPLTGMVCWAFDAGPSYGIMASFFGTVTQAGKSIEFSDSSADTYVSLTDRTCTQDSVAFGGSKFCFDLFTEISSDTTVTVDIYLGAGTSNIQTNPIKILTYTHTFTAPAPEPDPEGSCLTVTAEDRDTAKNGLQVYAGDEVTVAVTAENSQNITVGYDSDLFTPTTYSGWTDSSGSLSWGGSTTDVSKLVFTAKAQTEDNKTAAFTLSPGSETPDDTKTVIIVLKPMDPDNDYTIENIQRYDGFNTVYFTYNGTEQCVKASSSLEGALVEYAEWEATVTDLEWSSVNPVQSKDVLLDKEVAIKITAPGYATKTEIVKFSVVPATLTITPKDVTINLGDSIPTTFEYDIDGLIGSDKIPEEPTFYITGGTVDTSQPGTYTIASSGSSNAGNYRFIYGTGKLIVKDAWIVKLDDTVYKIEKGQPFTFPTEAPTKPGYIFMGWRGADGVTYQPGDEVSITGDTSFKAIWANMPDITPGTPDEPDVDVFPFYDVSAGAWYYDAVKYVYDNGIMNGVTATEFSPNTTLNRAMIWTMLARLDGVNTDGGSSWYAKAQAWAMSEGVSDGTDPMGAVTREQLVTMLWRFKGEPAVDFLLTSPDADTISDWAHEAMRWAVSNGIIEGDENGCITPTATATRAQAAAIFMRLVEQ